MSLASTRGRRACRSPKVSASLTRRGDGTMGDDLDDGGLRTRGFEATFLINPDLNDQGPGVVSAVVLSLIDRVELDTRGTGTILEIQLAPSASTSATPSGSSTSSSAAALPRPARRPATATVTDVSTAPTRSTTSSSSFRTALRRLHPSPNARPRARTTIARTPRRLAPRESSGRRRR